MSTISDRRILIALAFAGAVMPALWLIIDVLMRLGGVWEYALDDVYIHLAMSEELAQGGYGVNHGEPGSASSSILFSYLLAPFAGQSWHWLVPLGIGQIALWVTAALWAWVLVLVAPYGGAPWRWPLFVLALIGPWMMYWPPLSVLGMEHILHVLVTLMMLLGLMRLFRDDTVDGFLIAGIVLNPLLRFEGAGLAFLGIGVLLLRGHRRTALVSFGLMAVPLAAYFWHMSQLGLDFLPNSVNAKSAVAGGGDPGGAKAGRITAVLDALRDNLSRPGGQALVTLIAMWIGILVVTAARLPRNHRVLGLLALAVLAGHLLLGSTAKLERYELYASSFAIVSAVVVLTRWAPATPVVARAAPWAALIVIGYAQFHYPLRSIVTFGPGSQAIHAQQRQMARFIDDHWQAPVAVNDLGHIAYRNPHYVLDLWGLANADALDARLRGSDPTWVDQMTRAYGVELALIYDSWLGHHMPSHWIKIGQLWLTVPRATLGANHVDIYAATPQAAKRARAAWRAFEPSLPASAELRLVPES